MIFTGCVVYITYLNRKKEAKTTYNALQEDGSFIKYQKTSRWD